MLKIKPENVIFDHCFSEPEVGELFYKFLQIEHNVEPFEFLQQEKKIKLLSQKEQIYFVAGLINTFIETKSKKEINVSGQSKRKLLQLYENQKKESEKWVLEIKPENILHDFKEMVTKELEDDSFNRFLNYYELKYREQENLLFETNQTKPKFRKKSIFNSSPKNEKLMGFFKKKKEIDQQTPLSSSPSTSNINTSSPNERVFLFSDSEESEDEIKNIAPKKDILILNSSVKKEYFEDDSISNTKILCGKFIFLTKRRMHDNRSNKIL
jgi:hypothetical protein